jgi:ribosome-interacting GTPase 1
MIFPSGKTQMAGTSKSKPGKTPGLNNPAILSKGSRVLGFAFQIHKDFAQKMKFARI